MWHSHLAFNQITGLRLLVGFLLSPVSNKAFIEKTNAMNITEERKTDIYTYNLSVSRIMVMKKN